MRRTDFPAGGFGPQGFGPDGFGPGGRRGPARGPEGHGGGRGRRRDGEDEGSGQEQHQHGPFGGPEAFREWLADPGNVPEAVREWLSDPANVPWGPGGRGRGGRAQGGRAQGGRGPGGRGPGGGRGRRGPRGFGRPGGWQQGDLPSVDDVQSWFIGRLPEDWFSEVTVTVDREELIVTGTLADTDGLTGAEAEGRISRFRSDSREIRMEIADEAQDRYRRKVSWAARAGDAEELFTNVSVPVMTRLRQPERRVLDTLVDAGVARSRSEALSWAVKLVGQHTEEWLSDLRSAMSAVDKLRSEGPDLDDQDGAVDDTDQSDTGESDTGNKGSEG